MVYDSLYLQPEPETSSTPSAAAVPEKSGAAEGDDKMKCLQCQRERKTAMARTKNFCTQRCIIQWMDDHPGVPLQEVMGDSSPAQPSSAAKPPQPKISRALKNLQIDMAPPGTKLPHSDESEEESESAKQELKNGPTLRAQTAAKRAATVNITKTPTAGTKRPSPAQQPSSVKKVAKSPANGSTPKSVTFNLGGPISSSEPTGGAISIVPLDRLSGPIGNALLSAAKKAALVTPVSTAKGNHLLTG